MLKMMGIGVRNGRKIKVVVFGFSHMNLDRLRKGEPIIFDGENVGIPDAKFVIFSSADERTMQRDFADLIGPNTNVKIDPRLKD